MTSRSSARTERSRPVGRLPSGERYYAPLGRMRSDNERVQCHLCGRWFKMVGGSHLLAAHGWTTAEYRAAFRLNVTASTVGPATADRKRESMFDQIARGERSQPQGGGGRHTTARWRSLAALRPDVAAEWHPTKNGLLELPGLQPETLGVKSAREVWWRCQPCGHEWRASIRTRCVGSGCPVCSQRELRQHSLAERNPDLAREWHPDLNRGLDPFTLGHASERKVWWRCSQCGHEWRATVKHRAYRDQGCPDCGKRRSAEFLTNRRSWEVPQHRSFARQRPDLLAEWHDERNQGLDPHTIGRGSNLSVWWRCSNCAYEWQARPSHRYDGNGCPNCSGRSVPGERSLGAMRPDLLADWHPDRNGQADPFAIALKTQRVRLWWRCRYCGHEWQTSPASRSQSKGGCRRCAKATAQVDSLEPARTPSELAEAARIPPVVRSQDPHPRPTGPVPSLEDLRRRRRELLLIAERHGASEVRVFGSIVRGDVGPGSDLDLLVQMGDRRTLLDQAGFQNDIEDLLGCPVHVTTTTGLQYAREGIRTEIEREAVPL